MKKILLTLSLVAFAFMANAQFVVGGALDYYSNGGSMNYTGVAPISNDVAVNFNSSAYSFSNYSILPKIGYQLNDKMQAGLTFGITGGTSTDFSMWGAEYMNYPDFEGWVKTTYSGFVIAPYFRYNLTKFKGFTLFCEAQLAFTLNGEDKIHEYNTAIDDPANFFTLPANDNTYDNDYKTNGINFSVVPGINYKFNEHFSADLYINLLRLAFVRSTVIRDNILVDGDKYVEHDNTFYFGADLTATSLANQLGNFRLGFNYHF